MILALAGGVGGAKLAQGLAAAHGPDDVAIVVNTGDDFSHLGLNISPDLDTVMYWLANMNDPVRGWGQAEETWHFMEAMKRLNGPSWFNLGDRDLATHLERTRLLRDGRTLSNVTRHLCTQLGVKHNVAPMSDAEVSTVVHTDEGILTFQDYFVRHQCRPRVKLVEYAGADGAPPSSGFDIALSADNLDAIVICPSNPLLSIEPILSLSGVRRRLQELQAPIVAVSPIIAGKAVKGPAAKMLRELGREASALGIARHYVGLLDGLIIDDVDSPLAPEIEALGIAAIQTPTLMNTQRDRQQLAETAVRFAASLRRAPSRTAMPRDSVVREAT